MKKTWLICIFVVVIVIAVLTGGKVLFTHKEEAASVQTEEALPTEEVLSGSDETQQLPTETTEPSQNEEVMLPRLYLNGDISKMLDKSDERVIAFTYEDGTQDIDGYLKIKIQGNSSVGFDKKNYTIKMYQDQECDKKLKVDVGWGEESKYCLKANWIDKTHARNIITARIASQVQSKYNVLSDTPNHGLIDGFPVEIYNNGAFLGLYTWNIPKDEWLLNMDGDNPDHIMICGEHWDEATLFWGAPNFTSWELEVGEDNDETLRKVNRLYEFIMYSTNEEFVEHVDEYLDLDALLNYYLVTDLAYLQDNLGKNMLLFTYDSEIWYLGLYDLDSSWGMYFNGQSLYNYQQEELTMFINHLFLRIETCFGDKLADRYFELREELFTKEHILNEFNSFRTMIPDEVFEREQIRWGTDIPGYSYAQIEEYLDCRIPVLDEKYSDWEQWISNRNQCILANFEKADMDEKERETLVKIMQDLNM